MEFILKFISILQIILMWIQYFVRIISQNRCYRGLFYKIIKSQKTLKKLFKNLVYGVSVSKLLKNKKHFHSIDRHWIQTSPSMEISTFLKGAFSSSLSCRYKNWTAKFFTKINIFYTGNVEWFYAVLLILHFRTFCSIGLEKINKKKI